jgi:hypothetical protein
VILAAVIGIAMTGCTSIYRRAKAHLPPELTTELSLRMAEATRAEQLTRQAGATLYDTLQKAPLAGRIQTDSDRLEAAAFDLERKVLAARDVAVKCGAPGSTDQELERLRAQSLAWLECAKDQRTADPAARIGRLQSLLEGSMPGAGSASESKRIQAH